MHTPFQKYHRITTFWLSLDGLAEEPEVIQKSVSIVVMLV